MLLDLKVIFLQIFPKNLFILKKKAENLLNIEGENLKNVFSAKIIVNW